MSINLPKNLKDIVSYILPITISFKFLKYDINILTLSTFSLTVTSTVIIVLLFSITLIFPTVSPAAIGAFILFNSTL